MKITCTQENLNKGLNIVSHIASKNTSLPILNNVLIKAEKGVLNLITTNLEMGIKCQIRGKIDKDGDYTVNSKLLAEYVNLLPNEKVDLEYKDDILAVKTEKQQTKIKGSSAEEFPLIPQVLRKSPYVCQVDDLLKAFSQVVFAVSLAETRPEISGIYFNFQDNILTLAATDSYRLAEKKIRLKEKGATDKEVIIPSKTVTELYRILSNLNGQNLLEEEKAAANKEIEIYFEDNQVLFVYNGMELVSRVIEGQYPNYRQIIPSDYKTRAIIDINQLIKSAKTASLFSRTGIYDINVELSKSGVTVSSTNNQLGESNAEVESKVEGDDNKIIVNYRYLLDGLQNMDTSQVMLHMTDAANPCVLRPAESLPDKDSPIANEDYLYIIMPIKQ